MEGSISSETPRGEFESFPATDILDAVELAVSRNARLRVEDELRWRINHGEQPTGELPKPAEGE